MPTPRPSQKQRLPLRRWAEDPGTSLGKGWESICAKDRPTETPVKMPAMCGMKYSPSDSMTEHISIHCCPALPAQGGQEGPPSSGSEGLQPALTLCPPAPCGKEAWGTGPPHSSRWKPLLPVWPCPSPPPANTSCLHASSPFPGPGTSTGASPGPPDGLMAVDKVQQTAAFPTALEALEAGVPRTRCQRWAPPEAPSSLCVWVLISSSTHSQTGEGRALIPCFD